MDFRRQQLEQYGFTGWIAFADIRNANPCPTGPGVYVVAHAGLEPPRFTEKSCGGWFKEKDPTVPPAVLTANWVDRAEVVYIGMASSLRRRLREFASFGEGKPVGHWGGRLIWQLDRARDLTVAWRETPTDNPREVETSMIAAFRAQYGKSPFANDPHLLGR